MGMRVIGIVFLVGAIGLAQDGGPTDPVGKARGALRKSPEVTHIHGLIEMGPPAIALIPDLIQVASSGDTAVRIAALRAAERLLWMSSADVAGRAGRFKKLGRLRPVVESGVKWVASQQLASSRKGDGRWDASQHGAHQSYDVGLTGLALLTLLAAGHTETSGAHRANVRDAVSFLLAAEKKGGGKGSFSGSLRRATTQDALATWALAEAYLAGSVRCRPVLVRAVESFRSRQRENLGWGHAERKFVNSDATFWVGSALRFAELGGIDVPQDLFLGMWKWFDKMVDPGRGNVGYNFIGSGAFRSEANQKFDTSLVEPITAGVLWMHRLCLTRADAVTKKSIGLVAACVPSEEPDAYDLYYWKFGAMAAPFVGSKMRKWTSGMVKLLVARQFEDGSWAPNDAWGYEGGRIWSTCAALLALTAPIRYPDRDFLHPKRATHGKELMAVLRKWRKDKDQRFGFEAGAIYKRLSKRVLMDPR